MITARNEKEIDKIIEYFIEEGFISCTKSYKPDLNEWKDYIKEDLAKKGELIFIPHTEYDVQENKIIKTINWHVPQSLEEWIVEG